MKRIKKTFEGFKKSIKIVTISLGLGVFFAFVYFILILFIHNRAPAETKIVNVDFSYKTTKQINRKLASLENQLLEKKIKVKLNDVEKDILIKDLGVDILTLETTSLINKHNSRNENPIKFFFPDKKVSISPIVKIDEEKLNQTLEDNFKKSDFEPKNASYYFEGKKLHTAPDKDGLVINSEKLKLDLIEIGKSITPKGLLIEAAQGKAKITYESLLADKTNFSSNLTKIYELIDPVYNENFKVSLVNEQDWVKFVENGNKIDIEIQDAGIDRFIDENISKWLDVDPDNVDIYKNEDGKVVIKGKGNDGLKIQRDVFKKLIKKSIKENITKIPIPIERTPPKISISDDLKALGINERLNIGHTSYYGSPANRVHNIKVGAERFNGKIIAAGETFSFNQNLGRVDNTTGYKKELVIKPEGTIPEYGGGICQVSTTLYRAALLSGLQISERNQHSYAVSYYSQIMGHGLDATIYLGGADLKITNNTPGSILMQTYIENDYELYFVIYGTKDGRSVEMEGPYISNNTKPGETIYVKTTDLAPGKTKQAEKAHNGFNALWYRYVTDSQGVVTKETISTKYKAVPAKVLVGEDQT
ncbi:hypothetical protein COU74_02720 [Candidatus Peregrinibacteria bacterium CG10_big_fil_rev_8_21_14_0_10_36_19]|nr:MAG: hypothetical protein COU74_02720 [Candidatus Peregrinibacteria bacterium CG10_big_fil_rev_8_21_14_0_10_36_19]